MSWARDHDPYILYMKNPETPGEYTDVGTTGTRYAIGWAKTGKGEFTADELEAGLIDSMMPSYLLRKEINDREDRGQRSSKRLTRDVETR